MDNPSSGHKGSVSRGPTASSPTPASNRGILDDATIVQCLSLYICFCLRCFYILQEGKHVAQRAEPPIGCFKPDGIVTRLWAFEQDP